MEKYRVERMVDSMKKKTYNNVMKATKMIQKKGYSFEEANQIAIRLFDEHTKDMNSIEFYIDKILSKEEHHEEFCVPDGRYWEPQPSLQDKIRIESENYKAYINGNVQDQDIPFI